MIIVGLMGVLSAIYIIYLQIRGQVPNTLKVLSERVLEGEEQLVKDEQITHGNLMITMSGSQEKSNLMVGEMINKAHEMQKALSHHPDCTLICQEKHEETGKIQFIPVENGLQVKLEGENNGCHYIFLITSERQWQQKASYSLKLMGNTCNRGYDQLRAYALQLYRKWHIPVKEYTVFSNTIKGKKVEREVEEIAKQLFQALNAVKTEEYRDNEIATTCSYYGYCPYVASYYKDELGHRSNMQIVFTYDEIRNNTKLKIAFPFYNEPF